MKKFKLPANVRILFLNDDKKIQDTYSKTLGKEGKVVVIESGSELIREVEKELPDLILISKDFESIQNIRSMNGGWEIPIILFIGKNSLGATDCITNWISPKELINKVAYWLATDTYI